VDNLCHEAIMLGLFCHWQNTTNRIFDSRRIWIWNC